MKPPYSLDPNQILINEGASVPKQRQFILPGYIRQYSILNLMQN